MTMKVRLKMKNGSHRYGINKPGIDIDIHMLEQNVS